ncbi:MULTISPECIES: poly(3-hydroxybutyrate) depolymerase [unclassified Burkholderia]|uniref:extracellular catalytic domain type 2 short-chain-length polyhydroxyalkanoate depolymerase n=1 Tax=unclassified Burkholderia TaxID=2613784 RepID=UPI000F5875E1|nr:MULTISPECIES: poly(3-hydroxybutyrate) depolymerase [unclassified Burkholderia]RQR38384.1 poly(3-hydroxybutyrate) depolymerase [Burkholderia sp. Bp9131]RQR68834.1 poly(3-hydroxybutyrate) depolymerase [Burkholderia sp. Bp9015]RQS01341.1 poly(3-hydroxybutyrate) depolymerase [Burkholderia sp. Bp8994]RQS25039.1 poly(3-hydroxybutyrate) depolymerase [Burkholderia sp. Bp8995]RQS32109.1 poly(3-hydroxybutyrate) depolymerase [Burkholderia sp. Bp8990]
MNVTRSPGRTTLPRTTRSHVVRRALGAACAAVTATVAVAALAALAPHAALAAPADPLPAYGADLQRTSVSGLSSGGFMAAQFDVAFSSRLIGAGIVAGGPFYCAGANALIPPAVAATTLCMQPIGPAPSAADAWRAARTFAQRDEIDDPANLRGQRIYVFSGAKDTVVFTRVVDQTARFYTLAQVPAANLQYRQSQDAGHAFITNRPEDNTCSANASPYIDNCGFQQAHDIVRWIYGTPDKPLNAPAAQAGGKLLAFDQRAFDPQRRASLGDTGYAYVPADCERATCAVHVVFHGCVQNVATVGERMIRGVGYNEIADTNRLIVLYPQVEKSAVNPLGCWDFWGYTSTDPLQPGFYRRDAPQMAAVMQMVQRLGAARR